MVGFEDYRELLSQLVGHLQKEYGREFISLVLYGSVSRGEAREDSDIDLILVLDNPPPQYYKRTEQLMKILDDVEREVGGGKALLNPIVFSKAEAMENRYLFLDILEDGKILYDRDDFFQKRLSTLKRRLQELGSKKVYLEDGSWYWVLKPDLKLGEIFEL